MDFYLYQKNILTNQIRTEVELISSTFILGAHEQNIAVILGVVCHLVSKFIIYGTTGKFKV